jgi:CheY-like chemotaxis protein/anti-anti-sigma regulatory factor
MQIASAVEGNKATLSLNGRFDFHSHRDFRAAYEGALGESGIREIEINFSAVDYLDSSALGMLLLLREKAEATGETGGVGRPEGYGQTGSGHRELRQAVLRKGREDFAVIGASLKILIADDYAEQRQADRNPGARVPATRPITAGDGQSAVDLFKAESPDLVFMDIMMPGMDGIEAVRRIRALPTEKWTPIIFYSALDGMGDIVRGLEAGGDDYLVKPASPGCCKPSSTPMRACWRCSRRSSAISRNWNPGAWRPRNSPGSAPTSWSASPMPKGLRDPMVQSFNLPADTFSGDLLCAARTPGEVLNVMLAMRPAMVCPPPFPPCPSPRRSTA